ncbi:FAD-binding oxidoreductase [Streptomyces sp. NPDC051000]|uniref:FAD-binding oxidoreductase n=1 Tax=Streptomyces sp. NPDC051000 TaxID=3155520 RepID=UPI0033D600B2
MSPHRRLVLASAAAAVLATVGASARGPSDPVRRPSRRSVRGPDFAALARSLDGRIVVPGDRNYPEACRLFQPRYDTLAPAAVAYPAHAADVAACLDFARRSAVPVVPRGGGHGYAGWSGGDGGLVVDVGRMAEVSVEGDGVRIGAGARLGEVNDTLAARGRGIPTGLCPSVGIAGLALGGGMGLASRVHGTTSDALTGARVVTADGIVREVDAGHDPDLFWALRGGGGGNFGVVTELRFRTHPVGDAAFAELHWSGAESAAVLSGWQRWTGGLADPFWSHVEFVIESGAESVPSVKVLCFDGRGELERQLTRLSDLVGREPRERHLVVRGYGDTLRAMAGCEERAAARCRLPGALPGHDPRGVIGRASYAARSDFWTGAGLPEAAVRAVLAAVRGHARATPAGGRGVVQFLGECGGAMNRPGPSDTAFVHRDSAFLSQYLAYWPESASPDEVARHQGWLDGLWQDLRPWASGRAYQNYVDPKLANWRTAYYGTNLARLQEVRRANDPNRLFRFPQAI